MTTYRWKFMYKDGRKLKSAHGSIRWTIGEWYHQDGAIKACNNGFHCSKKVYEAFSYVQGDVLARVEVKGKHDDESDKSAYSDMRIVEAYKWTKKDSVALSVFAAEMCLDEFEKLYPDDKRPRNAIEAAKAVLLKDTKKNREAARSAARSAASSAASSAESAACSARSAARSAESAACSAAWSAARSAAWSAARSAASSAESAAIKRIDRWMVNRVKELEKL